MKSKFYLLSFVLLVSALSACGVPPPEGSPLPKQTAAQGGTLASPGEAQDLHTLMRTLDELAEIERAGSWFQGIGLTESALRENAGDYAGSVAAAYKELSWAYGLGLLQKEDLEKGLLNVLTVQGEETVAVTTNAILAFLNGQWKTAAADLSPLFNEADEPDGFGRWMILVCALELSVLDPSTRSETENRRAAAAYKSIRARYAQFPEYWYRGARAFSGVIAAEFAENCINSSPNGPYAQECRKILAAYAGLKPEDGSSIKTKREIEAIIALSVNSANPQILDSLMPLISLPDNPYTVYAVGALRALTGSPKYRDYFNGKAASARGRLAERLSYICRS